MNRSLLILGTLSCLAAGSILPGWVNRRETPSAPPAHPAEPISKGSSAVLARLNLMEDRLQGMESEVDGLYQDRPQPATGPAGLGEPGSEPPEAQLTPEQQIEALNIQFAADPRDGSWAIAAEGGISDGVRGLGEVAILRSVSCHSSLCRVEINTQPGTEGDATLLLPDAVPWPSTGVFAMSEDRPGEVVLFVYREGHEPT